LWEADGCLALVLQNRIAGAQQLADGRILAWGADARLLEDIGCSGVVLADTVDGVRQLADGRILSWKNDYKKEYILKLWGIDGGLIATLEGHSYYIYGALQLRNGRILTWSSDETLRLWDEDGSPMIVYMGQAPFTDCILLRNGIVAAADNLGHLLFLSVVDQ